MASEMRAKAVSIAGQFGYAQDDAEDIAQDVMLKLRDGVYALDINKARANAGLGYGWNRIKEVIYEKT